MTDYALHCPECGEPLTAWVDVVIPTQALVQLHEPENLLSYFVDLVPEDLVNAAKEDYSWELVEFTCPACGESWSPSGMNRALLKEMNDANLE